MAGRMTSPEILQASDFQHALAAIGHSKPTRMAIVDFHLPGMSGASGLRKLRADHPSTSIVVVADTRERDSVLEAMSAGVHGYILKDAPADEMSRALDLIESGFIYVPSLVSDISVRRSPAVTPNQMRYDNVLTERQLEVLQLVAAGRSNKEIARLLQITEGTVKVHVTAVFRTLGVHNRISAVAALQKQKRKDSPSLGMPLGLFLDEFRLV